MTDLPYRPSSQNQFFSAVRKLPVPRLLVFVSITIGFSLLNAVVPWLEGGLAPGEFDVYQLNFLIWLLVVMVAGDYYISAAASAFDEFRPALGVDDETFERLRFEYTHVPARTGWLITFLAAALSVWGLSLGQPYQRTGLSAVALYLTSVYMFWLVFFFMYFLFRIVRRTADLYGLIQEINIFHLQPLYGFSGLSARIGMFLVGAGVLSYLSNFVFTESPNPIGFGFFSGLNVLVAIAVFLYPLNGIHLRLVTAKEQAAQANDLRLAAAHRELHRRTDAQELAEMADLHHEIQAIFEYRREIQATSTWPWGSGTVRAFVTALLVPIILWATQQFLERVVGA